MLRIKELREESHKNMRQTAKELGIPYTTYISYEKGDREPNTEMLIMLAQFFGCSIDYLVGRSNDRRDNTNTSEPQTHLDLDAFGEKLKNARNKKGFTQSELAEKTCVSEKTITELESGKLIPKINTLAKLSEVLEVPIVHLCGADYAISLISAKAIDICIMSAWDMMIMGDIKKEEIRDVFFVNPMFIQHFFDNLNDEGKIEATKYVERLTRLDEYKKTKDSSESGVQEEPTD